MRDVPENPSTQEIDRSNNVFSLDVMRRRSSAQAAPQQPYLNDDERIALRRMIDLLPRIEAAVRKIEHLEHACPTAKRELHALLLGNT